MNEYRNLPRERMQIYAADSTSSLQDVIVNGSLVPQLAKVSA